MFWNKKNNDYVITTKITKTSNQAQFEREIKEKVEQQSSICPECGHINRPRMFGSTYVGTNIHTSYGECEKCGTKWEVDYRL